MEIGDRAYDVGRAAVHAANYGIGEAGKGLPQVVGRGTAELGKADLQRGLCGGRNQRDARLVPADLCKAGADPGGKHPYQRKKALQQRAALLLAVGITFAVIFGLGGIGLHRRRRMPYLARPLLRRPLIGDTAGRRPRRA